MHDRVQNPCQHCGAPAEEATAGQQVFIRCTNDKGYQKADGTQVPLCGMETPRLTASLDYGAWDRVTAIWNRSETSGPGSRTEPLPVPQAAYNFGLYYLEGDTVYLCFKEYEGTRRPSELIDHNFAAEKKG